MITRVFGKRAFSGLASQELPVINIESFLDKRGNYIDQCKQIADRFHENGYVLIKDPRVDHKANESLTDMMEQYFEDRNRKILAG